MLGAPAVSLRLPPPPAAQPLQTIPQPGYNEGAQHPSLQGGLGLGEVGEEGWGCYRASGTAPMGLVSESDWTLT